MVVLLSWQILIGWESIASLSDFVTSRAQGRAVVNFRDSSGCFLGHKIAVNVVDCGEFLAFRFVFVRILIYLAPVR